MVSPMPESVILYGPAYSTYTRTARLSLEEKGVDYRLEEVDFLRGANKSSEHLARHPFGKVPVLQHDEFMLHETAAITRYVDEAFDGPPLQPEDLQMCARTLEIVGTIVSYIYPVIVGQIIVERLMKPLIGQDPDEANIKKGTRRLEKGLLVLENYVGDYGYLLGDSITLADLYLIPMWAYFLQTPEGSGTVRIPQNLNLWWSLVKQRPSVANTETP